MRKIIIVGGVSNNCAVGDGVYWQNVFYGVWIAEEGGDGAASAI